MLLVVANQKGGVGKTTTAANLAVCLARRGARVLCVDCDPQFTLTRQVGIDSRWLGLSLVDALAGRAGIGDVTVGGVFAGVDVVPSSRDLVGVEMALVAELGRERFLRDALEPVVDSYEHVVIDTSPNLGLLTVNALVCAEVVLAPVSCEDEASVQGLAELRSTLAKLPRLGAGTPELACVLTRWVPQRLLGSTIERAVTELGVPVIGRVPSRAAVGHAAARRMPLACASPDGAVALAYERLAGRLGAVIAR